MAMSGTGLANAIKTIPGITITDDEELVQFCDVLVNYIKQNASVNPANFTVASIIAPTGGGPCSGSIGGNGEVQ